MSALSSKLSRDILRFWSLLGLLILVLTGCSMDAGQPTTIYPTPDDGNPLSSSLPSNLSANGILQPINKRMLSFQTGGIVEILNVEVGMTIQNGQILAVLDDTEL